jgi:ParB family chromosome partitioning protein
LQILANQEIPMGLISDPKCPLRSEVSRREIEDLIVSIGERGLLQPLLVRAKAAGYELIAGSRRLRACRSLGYQMVPCKVVEASDQEAMELSIIENVQRQTLNPIDEAVAYKRYIDEFGYGSVTTLAEKIGKSQEYVSLRLSLLRLPKEVIEAVISRQISPSCAQELLPLSFAQQRRIAALVVEKHLTKREVRTTVRSVTREEFEGVEWLRKPDVSVKGSREIDVAACEQSIEALKLSARKLSDTIEDLPETSVLRDLLFEFRFTINTEIDSLIKFKKRALGNKEYVVNGSLEANQSG